MSKGLFLLSFMNVETEPSISGKDLDRLSEKIKPIIKKLDCDIIVTNKPCIAIDKNNFKKYLKSLLKEIDKK